MSKENKQLLKLLDKLSAEDKRSLLDFAEFLQQRSQSVESPASDFQHKSEPILQPRPENENIINAIKRLRASYFMLNTDDLLNETSSLMTQHIVHGRLAVEVIDDLEVLFEDHYQKYLQS
jgi:hypothetical protein